MPLKVCAVTGSRADYGLLAGPMRLLREDPFFALQIVATGQHLTPSSGNSLKEVERDGFVVDARVDMLLAADTPAAVTKSMGVALMGFAEVFERSAPDLLLLLGDRYEILVAAQAALLARIPIAHLCGGDVTEGAIDDAIRHALTKMSHLHFVTTTEAARRVRQMGEDPGRVHVVGSSGVDMIQRTQTMTREQLFADLGMSVERRSLLVTFHPATLGEDSEQHCAELLAALHTLCPEMNLIFTGVNADPGGRSLQAMISGFCAEHPNARSFDSLGARRYYSALAHVDVVVGNSSSGLCEAPSFHVPTVNIGDRQKGRLKAASVLDCPPERTAIGKAIAAALAMDCSDMVNPYGDGRASERIVQILKEIADPKALLRKTFHMSPIL